MNWSAGKFPPLIRHENVFYQLSCTHQSHGFTHSRGLVETTGFAKMIGCVVACGRRRAGFPELQMAVIAQFREELRSIKSRWRVANSKKVIPCGQKMFEITHRKNSAKCQILNGMQAFVPIERSRGEHFFRDVIGAIKSEQAVHDRPSAAWPGLLSDLEVYLTAHPERSNDDQLVSALIEFTAKFTDQTALALITSCCAAAVGCSHGLWVSAVALKHERLANYVKCLRVFKEGIAARAEPHLFMMHELSNFKTRMTKRLAGQARFDLGVLDGVIYTFCAGNVVCRLNDLQPTTDCNFLS
jgi:hypothetical protein